ncbi:MAG: Gfo/Idh/MocA family oxidoreductase [Candidatus Nealsonbacteria bacterium]|nr:Gfo/Idh/MocA family oxidoreductase [Candidatus Nealsonbacteria bacterium]
MHGIDRRDFLKSGSLAAGAGGLAVLAPRRVFGAEANSRIKLGVIGCGGRGLWIAHHFARHAGYEIHAIADYFQSLADAAGNALKVDKSRCFSGLSGYRKLIAAGVDAVALETPPYCFPEHARAAVDAGLHVYMAKPVAVDVPGTLQIGALGKKATENKRCFLVDFQVPTDPHNREAVKRVHEGAIGRVAMIQTCYLAGQFADPPLTDNVESRLRRLVWVNDVALGGAYHVNAGIHGVDAGLWVARARPVSATGISSRGRPNPHGDSHDQFSVSFEFADGTIMNHVGTHLNAPFHVRCVAYGQTGIMEMGYVGEAFVRKGSQPYKGGEIDNLYTAGAVRNIDTFHKNITGGDFANPTVEPSVDSTLATILGREAALRRTKMTMEELLKENKRIEPDLRGLKA